MKFFSNTKQEIKECLDKYWWFTSIFNEVNWIFLAASIVISALTFFASFTPSKESLLWFFSTTLQGFAALVAFLGVVVIFKLRVNLSHLSDLVNRSSSNVKHFKGLEAESYTEKETKEAIKELKERKITEDTAATNKVKLTSIKEVAQSIETLEESNESAKSTFLVGFIWSFLVIFLSLLGLFLIDFIHLASFNLVASSLVFMVSVKAFYEMIKLGNIFTNKSD